MLIRNKILICFTLVWLAFLVFDFDISVLVGEHTNITSKINDFSSSKQNYFYKEYGKYLFSPQLEFFLGITLGSESIKKFSRFNDVTLSAGMMHAIVASGYNINLVFTFLFTLLGNKYNLYLLLASQIVAVIYAFLTGFNVPIIRATLMVSVLYWTKYLGYTPSGLQLVVKIALLMLIFSPSLYQDLSFLYTVLATIGLSLSAKLPKTPNIVLEMFQSSLMAQVFILPLGLLKFGTLNILGLLSTVLLSPVVSIVTVLGFLVGILIYLAPNLVFYTLILVNFLLSIFTFTCEILGSFNIIGSFVGSCIFICLIHILIIRPLLLNSINQYNAS